MSHISDEMLKENMSLDQKDSNGNTPLHLAAKKGNLLFCATLLRYGAQVLCINELGLKPYDYAKKNGHEECAEYLLLYGASSEVAHNAMISRKHAEDIERENLMLRNLLKDVLKIAKTLSIERDHLCRDLGHLYDSIIQLHDSMTLEIQILSAGGETRTSHENSAITGCTALHEKWQEYQTRWFSNDLVDRQHKLIVAEEQGKKLISLNNSTALQMEDKSLALNQMR